MSTRTLTALACILISPSGAFSSRSFAAWIEIVPSGVMVTFAPFLVCSIVIVSGWAGRAGLVPACPSASRPTRIVSSPTSIVRRPSASIRSFETGPV